MKQPTSSAGHVELTPKDEEQTPVNQSQQDQVIIQVSGLAPGRPPQPTTAGHVQLPTIDEQTEVNHSQPDHVVVRVPALVQGRPRQPTLPCSDLLLEGHVQSPPIDVEQNPVNQDQVMVPVSAPAAQERPPPQPKSTSPLIDEEQTGVHQSQQDQDIVPVSTPAQGRPPQPTTVLVQSPPIDEEQTELNQSQQDQVMVPVAAPAQGRPPQPTSPGHVQSPRIDEEQNPVNQDQVMVPVSTPAQERPPQPTSAGHVQSPPIDLEHPPVNQSQQDQVVIDVPAPAQGRPAQPTTGHVQLPTIDENTAVIFPSLSELFLEGRRKEYIKVGIPLYEASIKGDWKAAQVILNEKPELVRWSITENGETALHVAVSAKKTKKMQDFVKNLVDKMAKEDLLLQNKSCNTALCLAAAAGNVEMAKILVEKNPALMTIPGSQKMMPLYMAALFGHRDVVDYLYGESKGLHDDGWNDKNRGWLLLKCVEADLFDIALKILKDRPELASDRDVLEVLAKKPDAFYGTSSNIFRKTFNKVFGCNGSKAVPEKDTEALQLLKIIWDDIAEKPKKEIDNILRGPPDAPKKEDRLPYGKEDQTLHLLKLISDNVKMHVEIKRLNAGSSGTNKRASSTGNANKTYSSRILFVAAEMGNTKFIVELIRKYPDLIWKVDDNKQTIFHIAVKHRHEGIYNLLYEIGSMKDLITPLKDDNDNNMLHLVGKSAKKKRLQDVSGVALQMQRELLWFKEVESMIPPSYRERKNKDGLTPYELFTKEHKDLVAQGEKWMKGTSSQCMVVAALIATIVFAAAFTVPGGYIQDNDKDDNGIPVFHSKVTFMVFVVADAISLFSSSASILMFLSILTSRYAERDFLQSLPTKLMIGLATLFLSITSMTVAFSVSFFVLYKNGLVWMPIVISMFAVLPVFLFAWLQYPLLADVRRSTYGSRYLFKPSKLVLYYEDHKLKPFLKGLCHRIKPFLKGLFSKFKR